MLCMGNTRPLLYLLEDIEVGYYTVYTLTWSILGKNEAPSCDHEKQDSAKFCPECGKPVKMVELSDLISDYIQEKQNESDFFYAIDPDGGSTQSAKWYDYDNEMKMLSRNFPEVLFTLHGEGEDQGDIWNAYYLNGKSQKAKAEITIPKFNISELK